jgi:hypothetical protein
MINIILKNKSLIKLYKYSLATFKFMNKHLYILSILAFIARARKSVYYKLISWLLKIVTAINLLITSGIFFSIVDMSTPLDAIYNFYNDLLGPYIKYMKAKINEMFNLFNNIEKKYVSDTIINRNTFPSKDLPLLDNPITSQLLDNSNELEETIEFRFNYKQLFFYSGLAFFVYFIYFIPGASTPPVEIAYIISLHNL